jgi:KamA family protein
VSAGIYCPYGTRKPQRSTSPSGTYLPEEFVNAPGFTTDPLEEQHSVVPGLLHKYSNRALLLVKGGCAVNCRYCFRRHFPYAENQGNKRNWQMAMEYIASHPELDEIIFPAVTR